MKTFSLRNLLKSIRGFSTIEALVAVLVVSVGAIGVAALHSNLTHAKNLNNQRSEAQVLSQQKMEELRNFDTLTAYDALASGTDTVNGANATYTRAWTVTDNTNPHYKAIQLTLLGKQPKERIKVSV